MYKNARPVIALNEQRIREQLLDKCNRKLVYLRVAEAVSSTNDEIMRLGKKLAPGEYAACVANQQSAGRGRNGRVWQSPASANIYMSLGLELARVDAPILSGMSLVAGVSIARYLQGNGLRAFIKWPNDILVDEKKLAGILIETRVKADIISIIIGIGVNIDMPEEAAKEIEQPWIDLVKSSGLQSDKIDRNELVSDLLNILMVDLDGYQRSGFKLFESDWEKLDILSGRHVTVITDAEVFTAKVLGLGEDFALKVLVDDEERQLYAADVKLKL